MKILPSLEAHLVSLEEMTLALWKELEAENWNPEILGAVRLGPGQDGYTLGFFTFHRGKPEHVTEAIYRFQYDFNGDVVISR